jgi:hypothetical protein
MIAISEEESPLTVAVCPSRCAIWIDGFISNGEPCLVIKVMVGNNLKVRLVPVRTDYLPLDIVKQMTLEDLRLF